MPEDTSKFIPESEIQLTFARSSGAGGQNVNKTSTKVVIHWSIGKSTIFTEEEKQRIRTKLANRLNTEDEIVIMSEEERSQPQNRQLAIERLQLLVTGALYVPKKRKPTRPTYSSKLKKVESKKLRSAVKKTRRSLTDFI